MRIEVLCPHCGAKKWAPADAVGRRAACPRCRRVLVVQAAPSAEADRLAVEPAPEKSTRKVPLHPGWRRVARGYGSLQAAILTFSLGQMPFVLEVLLGVFAKEIGVPMGIVLTWGCLIVGALLNALGLIFTLMGHLYFVSMPRRTEGGQGRWLAIAMLVCLLLPPAQFAWAFLLARFSAGMSTALRVPSLSVRGGVIRVWGFVVPAFMAVLVAVIIFVVFFVAAPVVRETGILTLMFAGGVLFLMFSWCSYELYHVFGDFRRVIASQIRRRGTDSRLVSTANSALSADERSLEREGATA